MNFIKLFATLENKTIKNLSIKHFFYFFSIYKNLDIKLQRIKINTHKIKYLPMLQSYNFVNNIIVKTSNI